MSPLPDIKVSDLLSVQRNTDALNTRLRLVEKHPLDSQAYTTSPDAPVVGYVTTRIAGVTRKLAVIA